MHTMHELRGEWPELHVYTRVDSKPISYLAFFIVANLFGHILILSMATVVTLITDKQEWFTHKLDT